MCESEAHGLPPESEGPSGVQKLNVSCPEGVGALGNARGSLVSVDSGDGLPNARETPRDDDDDDEATSNASEASNEKSNLQQSSVDMGEPRGVCPPTSQESLVVEDVEAEGVDPFSMKPSDTTDSPLERKPPDRRGSKTVNFKDPEVETPIQNGKSQENVNISSCGSSKGTSGDLLLEDGSPEKGSSNRHRALGEGNPVYRLSLKLSTNLFNMTEIPGANQHREAEKVGYLTKLSSRSFPYISQWKRRYCVLAKGRLYYYEREDSKPGEKSNGVINLEYFDHVAEAGPKDCKKATNVFVITSQDRSFFDPGRHLFSADTLPDMKDWIRRLQSALDQIRNNNRPATSTSLPSKDGGKKGREENLEKKENLQNRENIMPSSNKERKKKKKEESHRSRKSARVGVSSETQTSAVEPISVTSEQEAEVQMMTSPKGGVQLLGLAPHLGVQLPGLSSKEVKPSVISSSENEGKRSSDGNEDLPLSGPTLACVTKNRVKGPQGRRAPQNHRRTLAASTLKKRASSLSALEYQDLNDNRSESSQGPQGSQRHSQTRENDIQAGEEDSSVRQVHFNDIEDDLFFKPRMREGNDEAKMGANDLKEKKRSSTLKVNLEERDNRRSTSRSRNGTLLASNLSRIRETMVSIKRHRFESKECIGPDHPDDVYSSRWGCTIL